MAVEESLDLEGARNLLGRTIEAAGGVGKEERRAL